VPRANAFLERNISHEAVGFEWGSGGSTLWFARHCRFLISIEHSAVWHSYVLRKLTSGSLRNVDYRYISLDHDESLPTQAEYSQTPGYVAEIDKFPDDYFDFCLVDGHYRQACVRAAMPKIKRGGFLIIDDTHFMPLARWSVSENWEVVIRHHTGLKETTIWKA
jgi:predicted O-methyltransferase YrrM